MTPYRHTQIGWSIVIAVGVMVPVTVAAGVLAGLNKPVALWSLGLFALLALLFGSLTTEIDDAELRCRFGIGPIGRRFPLHTIEQAAAVRNHWYYGWGIRYTPHGWMFNVWGLDAVQISFHDGKRFRIGTDEPERLARAINERVGHSTAQPERA